MGKWYQKVNMDAKAAYYLTLSEKISEPLDFGDDWDAVIRKSINLCWEWVEAKMHDSYAMYDGLTDEDEGFYVLSTLDGVFQDDLQAESAYWCLFFAVSYTLKQALIFENKEHHGPQELESVNDDSTYIQFMEEIKKTEGYQEEWSRRLKEHLLKNYPAGSDEQIKREELLALIV
ncbi:MULTISPECIES: Imm6 family immunity protein [Thermoactinomyces]|jgi:hypothetical protein|uniref:Immunity protein Imm6 n=2 Tax=Thermoactinomyces TaxID=2023 RepID=A0A8I1A341_THEIN|nr:MULTISPECIES: Imm6 family immunity protein [Thermoactinomyces]KFZ41294.1 hypothetical protein JS81_02750 [Thermoactinomyces sp. Gus2-1]KYQ87529.1 hypothetical protein AYX07_02200 [Thermoactinomyces sp. AS95]MBA4548799.1 hypothetical protein [Thermoactinomyces intermedius]MBA4551303.1 hypothetical protein [Thermoactinomyces vulgaris]MBA4595486.1 hypothetical protein [Thermoactinomyces vulgaris]